MISALTLAKASTGDQAARCDVYMCLYRAKAAATSAAERQLYDAAAQHWLALVADEHKSDSSDTDDEAAATTMDAVAAALPTPARLAAKPIILSDDELDDDDHDDASADTERPGKRRRRREPMAPLRTAREWGYRNDGFLVDDDEGVYDDGTDSSEQADGEGGDDDGTDHAEQEVGGAKAGAAGANDTASASTRRSTRRRRAPAKFSDERFIPLANNRYTAGRRIDQGLNLHYKKPNHPKVGGMPVHYSECVTNEAYERSRGRIRDDDDGCY